MEELKEFEKQKMLLGDQEDDLYAPGDDLTEFKVDVIPTEEEAEILRLMKESE